MKKISKKCHKKKFRYNTQIKKIKKNTKFKKHTKFDTLPYKKFPQKVPKLKKIPNKKRTKSKKIYKNIPILIITLKKISH